MRTPIFPHAIPAAIFAYIFETMQKCASALFADALSFLLSIPLAEFIIQTHFPAGALHGCIGPIHNAGDLNI